VATSAKINSLQVYRAVAAILVVLFHITNYGQEKLGYQFVNGAFSFGYTGVDFFFVLSGFIIFYTHAVDIGCRPQMSKYLAKRIIRVYPIYWLVTIVKVFTIFLLPRVAKPYERQADTILKSLLLWPQVHLPVIGAAWTLSHEMLFYLAFASIIWFGWRWGLCLLGIGTVAIVGLTIGRFAGMSISASSNLLVFLLSERNLEFVLGCLSAYIVMNYKLRHQALVAAGGAILFAISGWFVVRGAQVYSYTALFGLPAVLLIMGSASLELKHAVIFPRPLVFLGSASYSIYLTHAMFVNVFALILSRFDATTHNDPLLITVGMALGAILGGALVYQYVERPLLFALRRLILLRGEAVSAL